MSVTLSLPDLYDHQEKQINELRRVVAAESSAILCANPGVGKTRMAKWMMMRAAARKPAANMSGYAVFAVHRRSLVDNASDSFGEEPELPHGLIMSKCETNWRHKTHVASIDTLLSWYVGKPEDSEDEDVAPGEYLHETTFDMVVFDECHSHFSKLRKWWDSHALKREELGLKKAVLIGLSATPECEGLSDMFDTIVLGPTTEWLIDNDYLSPFRYFCGAKADLSKLVKTRAGEYTEDSVCSAFEGLTGSLVSDWKKFAEGRPTIGFFPRLAQAREAQAELIAEGIVAEYIDGTTPDDERHRLFEHLSEGRIDYLCNVGVCERGLNLPIVSAIQLCTSVGTVVRYRQMIGRGSRTHPKKSDCIVIDHGGNIVKHGLFEDEIPWDLTNKELSTKEHNPPGIVECPICGRTYRGGRCMSCGHEPSVEELQGQGLMFDGGELIEYVRTERQSNSKSVNDIMVAALYRAAGSGRTWQQAMGMAFRMAENQGTRDTFKIPKSVTVGGQRYYVPPYGSPDGHRRAIDLFEFLERKFG